MRDERSPRRRRRTTPGGAERSPGNRSAVLGRAADGVVAALASAVLAVASSALVEPSSGNAAVWLPAGVALGVLALAPLRRWPALVAGAAVGSLAADLVATDGAVALSLGWTAANVAMWVSGGAIARGLAGGVPDLRRAAHVGVLVVTAAVGPAVGAAVGALVSHLHHDAPFLATAWTWWLSDWTAALALMPLALTLRAMSRRTLARLLVAGLAGAGVSLAVVVSGLPLGALVVLPVVAAGGLLGPVGAAVAGAATAAVLLPATLAGAGPFAGAAPGTALVVAQVCATAALLTGMLVAVLASLKARSHATLEASEARYRAVVDNLAEGLVVHGADGAVASANAAALEILGLDSEALRGMHPGDPRWQALDVDGRDLPPGHHPVVEALVTGRRVRSRVIGVPLPAGPVRWLSVSAQPLPAAQGGGVVSLFTDVSEQRRTLAALRDADKRFRAAFETAPVGVVLVGLDGRCLEVNTAFAELVGVRRGDLVGRDFAGLAVPEDSARALGALGELLAGARASIDGEARYRRPDRSERWGDVRVALVRDDAGVPAYAVAQVADVTDRRAAHDALAHRATHDALTGLADRGVVRDRLGEVLAGSGRTTVGVLFVDLDDFKDVNDLHGHEVGDEVLTAVATRLAGAVRDQDLVGRLGGDEFVVVCDGVDADALGVLATRVGHAVAGPMATRAGALVVTASVGWALAGETGGAEEVLAAADREMYAAKRDRPGRRTVPGA